MIAGYATHAAHHGEGFIKKYLWSTDHKIIAMQYLFTGMLMALIGGFTAYVFRMQLAFPGQPVPLFGRVSAASYNSLVTMHGTIMIFWVAMPVLLAAFGNFLIPLMLGCDDMVFPRVNRLSYQVFLLSAIVLVASFFVPHGAFGGAWTAYPPLSAKSTYNLTPYGSTLWVIAVALEFAAFLLGGVNFVTTAMNSRAPGMTMFDVPLVVWMIVIASVLFMASVGPLLAGAVMLLLDQTLGTGFYDPATGGDPVLWQHLFWFFGHPAVYVVLLPAMGIVAEVIAVFSRQKIFGYKTIVSTAVATGVISFFVWAHHQFIAGIDPRMASLFTVTTLIISVPIAEMVFLYIATLYGGSITLTTPMLWALSFVAEFMIGGVTGIFLGAAGSDRSEEHTSELQSLRHLVCRLARLTAVPYTTLFRSRMASLFTVTTLIISVPIAEMVFLYIATLYGGSITLTTPMLWALSFVAEFMIGGVTGIFLGAAGSDIYLHDTYFVLAHFHYTFFPIAI